MSYANDLNTDFLTKAKKIVEDNLSDELFGVSELARDMGISRSYLHRKISFYAKTSVSKFMRQIRLTKAKEMLRETALPVSEIAYNVGYSSVTYFSKCYHDYFGYSPGDERRRKGREKETAAEVNQKSGSRIKRITLVSVVIMVVALSLTIVVAMFEKGTNLNKSIAVLPPNYTISDSDSMYFQLNGTIGMIIDNLSKIKDLEKVIPWISVQQYVNSNKTAAEIAKELKVSYLITSSVIATEDGNYLNIMLINGKDGNQEWSSQYEMHSKEIIKLPTIIAHDIANNIHIEVTQQEKKRIEKIPTLNTEAYNLYLRGRFFWNTRTEDGIRTSVDLFRKAVEIDENYALAWSGLADAYCILSGYGWYTPKKEGEELAKKYARKAIEIDNNLAEAHTALGFLLCYNEWRWDEAEKELEEAIRLNPNYSFAHLVYALLHDIRGNGNKARDEINIALELDPFAPVLHSVSATLYYNEGNYDRSIQEYREILKLEKNYTAVHWWLFKNYYRKGEGSNATDVLQKILRLEEHTAFYSDDVKRTYMNAGLEGVIESIIEITEEVKLCIPDKNVRLYWESYLPEIYAMSGRREEALTLLENYLEKNLEGDRLVRLINNPDYTTLRNEKRFIKVIDNLGLKEYYENSIENQKILSETD